MAHGTTIGGVVPARRHLYGAMTISGFWNSFPCDGWGRERSDGATPPPVQSTELDLPFRWSPTHDGLVSLICGADQWSIRVGADTDLEAAKAGDAAEARADVHDLDGLQHVGETHRGGR